MPDSSLTRATAPELLRELETKRASMSKSDPGLPKIIIQIATLKSYLKA